MLYSYIWMDYRWPGMIALIINYTKNKFFLMYYVHNPDKQQMALTIKSQHCLTHCLQINLL
jgi:hypothetical protein